jgi:hypothetical protein
VDVSTGKKVTDLVDLLSAQRTNWLAVGSNDGPAQILYFPVHCLSAITVLLSI